MNDDILLTREQVGTALGYADPSTAITKIHIRHKDRLDSLSVTTKLEGTDGKLYRTHLYSEKGIMEICRWSNKPNANKFMDWVWDIVEKYRNEEPNQQSIDFNKVAEAFSSTLKPVTEAMTSISDRLSKIEEQQSQPKLPKKRYSRWTSKTFDKLNSILKYINANSSEQLTLPNIIHMMIRETEDTYDIEVADYVSMYECEFQVDKPYPLTAIEHYKEVRDMFTFTLDSKLEGLGIQEEKPIHKRTIIDELIERRKLNLENKILMDENSNVSVTM